MNPAFTARLDQASAASNHLHSALTTMATGSEFEFGETLPAGATRRLVETLIDRIVSGRTGYCEHAAGNPDQVLFWVPYKPGKIRCAPCALRVEQRMKGTREDFTCDGCRRHRSRIAPCWVILPAVAAPQLDFTHGPILLSYGLCRKCFADAHPDWVDSLGESA